MASLCPGLCDASWMSLSGKQDLNKECQRQLFDINTHIRLSMEEMERLIAKIQMELLKVVNSHEMQKVVIRKKQRLF